MPVIVGRYETQAEAVPRSPRTTRMSSCAQGKEARSPERCRIGAKRERGAVLGRPFCLSNGKKKGKKKEGGKRKEAGFSLPPPSPRSRGASFMRGGDFGPPFRLPLSSTAPELTLLMQEAIVDTIGASV